ncbi:polysaccharide deacetylase family protein [Wolbachia pipientis]|nr:polysaccharide deacetylase family protein [Wolbachia pipientis]
MNIKKLLHNNEDRFIALTFDDGPSSLARVNSILNVLEEHNAKATFFLLGERINSSSRNKAVKKIYNAGHEIGNHSWSHRKLTTLSSEEQFQELEGTNIAIERIIGKGVKWFRPPGGSHDESVINHAKQLNMCSILWTIDSLDWRGENPEVLVERVISSVHNGAIILLHDHHRQNTVEALPRIITILTKLGYSLVTLSEWEEKVCDALGKKQSF